MPSFTRKLLIFLVLLVPSAAFAWRNRDMPQFAYLHDDGVLFVSGKSLGDGFGYRIPSLVGEPWQAKFPVLYPLYLSAIWRLNPQFPANLVLATWMSWLTLVAMLALSIVWSGQRTGDSGK